MPTTTLPIQISGAAASPTAARSNGASGNPDNNGFSQTFAKAAQRQATPAPAPAPAAAPKANSQPNRQAGAPADKAPAARPSADGAKPAQANAANAAKAEKQAAASAKAADTQQDAAAAAEAAASTPVIDMLALVASFNQPAATPAAAAPSSDDGAPALPGGATPGSALKPLEQSAAGMLEQLAAAPTDGEPALELADSAQGASQRQSLLDADDSTAQRGAAALGLDKPGARAGSAEQFSVRELTQHHETTPTGAAGALAPAQQTGLAQAAASVAGDKLPARVGTSAWDNQVAQKIVWMVAGAEQSATLTLNPPDMGPLQVVLNVTNDHAEVTFSSAQPEVRQALEDAMPRLRELMSESGLSLGSANVNADVPQERQAQAETGNGRGGSGGAGEGGDDVADNGSAAAAEAQAEARAQRSGTIRSMVDTFV